MRLATRFCGLALGLLVAVSAPCAVKVSKTGAYQWSLESSAIKVTLDGQRACFDVVDKRSGQRWVTTGTRAAIFPVAWTVGLSPEALSLDGTIGEQEWPGPRIDLTGAGNLTWGNNRPAASDFSGHVFVCHHQQGLLLGVRVRDDAVMFPQTDEREWWEWDSAEFWVGSQQYAIIPAPPAG
ncbi:MAG: hypothetical protein N2512_01540, partial [Armatimonadetes bacterium]|nr:hypothetical protein [Armatimonadota bacterium]